MRVMVKAKAQPGIKRAFTCLLPYDGMPCKPVTVYIIKFLFNFMPPIV